MRPLNAHPMSKPLAAQPVNHLHATEARWFAVYVNYKREKQTARDLAARGIEVYVPLKSYTRVYASRKRTVELPLLSRYVFVRITRAQYVAVLENPHVLGFVKEQRNLRAIREEEIELLRRVAGDTRVVEVRRGQLTAGEEVELITGHLAGLRGQFVRERGKHHFIIRLESLGVHLEIGVDPADIRRPA